MCYNEFIKGKELIPCKNLEFLDNAFVLIAVQTRCTTFTLMVVLWVCVIVVMSIGVMAKLKQM
mgnify:CR=1 FL=1